MRRRVFGGEYADQYDLLYGNKDYDGECDLLETVFRQYSETPVRTVLDLGCGTGNHALPLARRGYQVTGVDFSDDMLSHARRKLEAARNAADDSLPAFVQGDVRKLELGQQFDVALMMFAVLGYQLTNEDVLAALRSVRRHLNPGGLFIADVWYGPAVLGLRPEDRVKVVPTEDGGKLLRAGTTSLDLLKHLATVHYGLWKLRGKEVVSETEETHEMRFFFPLELALFFTSAGLKLMGITAFPSLDRLPDETSWNVLVTGAADGGR